MPLLLNNPNVLSVDGPSWCRRFPARPEAIRTMRSVVGDYILGLGWTPDERDELVLAVGEACNNAVRYGSEEANSEVTLCGRLSGPQQVEIEIWNFGEFQPNLARLRELPSEESTHGRGFALMSALVDEVRVFSDGVQTVVRLVKIHFG